jgi:hypothetical protein
MRKKNPRLVMVGFVMLAMAAAFFLLMLSIAGKSNDPVELMRTVGGVSGIVTGIGLTMIALGFFGKAGDAAPSLEGRQQP